MTEGDLILIRETVKGKQEVVYFINKETGKERIKEKINMVIRQYPKDLILITELKSVEGNGDEIKRLPQGLY